MTKKISKAKQKKREKEIDIYNKQIKISIKQRLSELLHLSKILNCPSTINSLAWKLESAAYLYSIKFKVDYYTLIEKQVYTLENTNKFNETNIDKMLFYTPQNYCDGTKIHMARHQKLLDNAKAFEILAKLENFNFDNLQSMMIVCRKCRNTDIRFSIKQKASADEPATVTCECANQNCKERWKLSR